MSAFRRRVGGVRFVVFLLACAAGVCAVWTGAGSAGDRSTGPSAASLALGREMFVREWLPEDSRAHGGDGLGPVFNESSCVSCHNLGGTGGGGPANKNVDILSAFVDSPESPSFVGAIFRGIFGIKRAEPPKPDPKKDSEELARMHPGFRTARSVVLHKFGTTRGYEAWRENLASPFGMRGFVVNEVMLDDVDNRAVDKDAVDELPTEETTKPAEGDLVDRRRAERAALTELQQVRAQMDMGGNFRNFANRRGRFTLVSTQRNTTALFGAGLIDSISEEAIVKAAVVEHAGFPKIKGRVCRLKDGKVGRFGWKAQKATLREFAMTACAVELGLNVPEQEQAGVALRPDYKAPGLDMNQAECDALVAFLQTLPAPRQQRPETKIEAAQLDGGEKLFAAVGCAACHTKQLGEVDGIYSDLLLHDMGESLGDTGTYGVFVPNSAEELQPEQTGDLAEAASRHGSSDGREKDGKPIVGARRLEWRTPPLWGVRDSAPYLHDGRAATLEQAIALHDGEAREATRRFFRLSPKERLQVVSFLKSLVAPDQVAAAR